ncbi:MAG: hypothetical protein IT488_13810 [Gammaproteobacteria bacterium]|nr:hypothetical protein [Gammaproteobacteria bacterium]
MGKNNKFLSVCSLFLAMFFWSVNVTAATVDDWLYETVPATYYYQSDKTGDYYPGGYSACVASMPAPYQSGQVIITFSNPRWAYYSNYGLGCEYRRVDTSVITGEIVYVNEATFKQNWIYKARICPKGFTYSTTLGLCSRVRQTEESSCTVGNPVFPGRGCKTEVEFDYLSASSRSPLFFARQYSSWHFSPYDGHLGKGWFIHIFGRHLVIDTSFIVATRALGETRAFDLSSGNWVARTPTADFLQTYNDGNGSAWRYYDSVRQAYEYYDAEPPRVSWRLQPLREWSHERKQVKQVFPGSA